MHEKSLIEPKRFLHILLVNGQQTNNNIYPSIIYSVYPSELQGSWCQSQLTTGERWGTPWVGCQSTRANRQTNSHSHLRADLTSMLLGCGSTQEHPGAPRGNPRRQKESMQILHSQLRGSNPNPSCWEATVQTSAPRCHLLQCKSKANFQHLLHFINALINDSN